VTTRSRLLVPLLALALTLPALPAMAQSDSGSQTMGDMIADGLEALAREIGSAQDDINDLAGGIDPSEPGGQVDPTDADSPIDPTDADSPIDPSDPNAPIDPSDPNAPIDPSDPNAPIDPVPADPGSPAEPGPGTEPGPEIEDLSEPDGDGGFKEIQLIPDPVPAAGRWQVINKRGLVSCSRAGGIPLPKTTQIGRISVRDEGRKLVGSSLFEGQGQPVTMIWDPNQNRYEGMVVASAPGGKTKLKFFARVASRGRMNGEMIATIKVNAGGVKESCAASRELVFKRQ
jgi:hypothetical protein